MTKSRTDTEALALLLLTTRMSWTRSVRYISTRLTGRWWKARRPFRRSPALLAWEDCTPPTWRHSHLQTTSALAGKKVNKELLRESSVMSAQVRQRQQQHDVQPVQRHQPVHQHPVYLGQLRRPQPTTRVDFKNWLLQDRFINLTERQQQDNYIDTHYSNQVASSEQSCLSSSDLTDSFSE